MTLPLTHETLYGAYKFLCATPPFVRWNLPEAADVKFRVVRDRTLHGWHRCIAGKHTIAISGSSVGHTLSLVMTMAHELVHMHQKRTGMRVNHGLAFQKLAQQICKIHGFDPKAF